MHLKKWALGAAAVALVAVAGAATLRSTMGDGSRALSMNGQGIRAAAEAALGSRQQAFGRRGAQAGGENPTVTAAAAADPAGRDTYIVVFKESALGAYRGEVAGLPAPARTAARSGKARLDVKGEQARNYVGYLRQRQTQHEGKLASTIGRGLGVRMRMQHAVNGIVTDLSQAEAARIGRLPEVLLVEAYREDPLNTDVGPGLIGAPPVWTGAAAGSPYQGEGVVFGIIDTGINFGSPSFAAVDPVDGYAHVNPLGAGTFLGTCQPGQVDEGRCNAKLIGGYDFVCGPPANQCGLPNIREEPGFGDTSGHGTHTASTAAGNRRDVEFRGLARRISGVAPRGNVVAYDVCYTVISTGQGLCPNVSTTAAINQAVADGIIDVINYSIGGGTSPWNDAVSIAFRNASNAGIYVAAAAGNSGPGPNTMGHLQPWVSSTAAAQHGRGSFSFLMQVTGPSPVPPALTTIVVNPGGGGVPHTTNIAAPLRVSPTIDTTDDGCSAFAADLFDGAIAVVRRGGCTFTIKTNNAAAAGAVAIVIANNLPGGLIPYVPGTTIPAFSILQSDGNALRDFHAANPTATALIGFPAVALPNTADALAAFSSRGPAGTINLLKPDITAPGVLVLAAYAGDSISPQFDNLIETISGTSMASPHQAGAAGLVRQARPNWTVPEIKSALMMTAKLPVFLEDQVTEGNPFARGAGRVQVDKAVNAGLVLHETTANYIAANPATGGEPANLNQPSLANGRCTAPCTFTRTFRNTTASEQEWAPRFSGLRGAVVPRRLIVPANGTLTVTFTIDVSTFPADGVWRFGTVTLAPLGPQSSRQRLFPLNLPVAVALPAPVIAVTAFSFGSVPAGGNVLVPASVSNIGGGVLAFAVDNTGTDTFPIVNHGRETVNSGFTSAVFTDETDPPAIFSSESFMIVGRVTSLFTEGYTVSGAALATVATSLHWSIFPDAIGHPAGNPQTSPGMAVWSYSSAPNGPGVSTAGNGILLDFDAAGQTGVVLPFGRYWLVVHATTPFASRWLWFGSPRGNGSARQIVIEPGGAWSSLLFQGLSIRVEAEVPCGAPWMGAVVPSMGNVNAGNSQTIVAAISAAALSAGTYSANICVTSNDPTRPKAAIPIRLQVN
jgi:subtilisin family serine protease